MPGVFVSYVREDAASVDRLVRGLEANGVKIWIDRKNLLPGYRWADAVRRGISEGEFFLACFSENYAARAKTYMNEELTIAIEELRQRPTDTAWFLPVKLSDCQIPERSIGGGETLGALQWVELFEDWDEGVRRILSVIRPQKDPLQLRERDLEIITHALGNPLHSILLGLDFMRRRYPSDERGTQYLEHLYLSARTMVAHLKRFRAVTLVLQEEPRVFYSGVVLMHEIEEVVALLRPYAMERGLDFRLVDLDKIPRQISADEDLIATVLFNVLDNAVRYSLGGSTIEVRGLGSKEEAKIEIRNRSLPIAPSDLHRLFDSGFRTREARLASSYGTGRGLYVARRIVEAHDGRISLRSVNRRKTLVVSIELPLKRHNDT